ncbi:AbrB/MazE/SpoVT family DNA-binding domain-containing protein [Luteimonas arsenica]|uniref:AbrB/MazE/SpoVT family DNA-binding domain-containing protein n=1 Tax=Luteimonas arsenica TaxID=1586242 RepID=UPI001054ECDB|nr:AbrB/MazE/SpoVT family DNA-binding domain-containing protein [Luteimonas arsenica]
MKVAKWGNSLAVRLPVAVVETLQLAEGDEIELLAGDSRTLTVSRKPGIEEMLQRLRRFRGRLPEDFRFDRDGLHERE